jgi:microsomal epoxide hydrolase
MTSYPNSQPSTETLDTSIPITPAEQQGILRTAEFTKYGSAYALLHATKPATLGLALSSPVALLVYRVMETYQVDSTEI